MSSANSRRATIAPAWEDAAMSALVRYAIAAFHKYGEPYAQRVYLIEWDACAWLAPDGRAWREVNPLPDEFFNKNWPEPVLPVSEIPSSAVKLDDWYTRESPARTAPFAKPGFEAKLPPDFVPLYQIVDGKEPV